MLTTLPPERSTAALRESQEERSVRRRSGAPRVTHRREVFRRAERGRTELVRADAAPHHQAVGRVAVEVAAEDRRPDEQRRAPHARDLVERRHRVAPAEQEPEHDPRAEDEDEPEGHGDRAENCGRRALGDDGQDDPLDRRTGRSGGADRDPGDGDQHHPDRAGRPEGEDDASRPLGAYSSGRVPRIDIVRHQVIIMVHAGPGNPSRSRSQGTPGFAARTGRPGTRPGRRGIPQPIWSVVGRAPSIEVNETGTGYFPSTKFRIAACCSSTGSIVAAVLIPAGADTTLIASR